MLHVADPERTARFWTDQLRLRERGRSHGRIELDLAGVRLLLHPTDLDELDRAGARHGRTEVYLQVDGIDRLSNTLAGSGVTVVQPPVDQPWGGERDASVLDPEGTRSSSPKP